MNKFIWIITIVLTWFTFTAHLKAQDNIDYSHKALQKELVKLYNTDISTLTEVSITSELPLQGKFFSIPTSSAKYIYVGRVNSCRAGGCNVSTYTNGSSEYFDYFIFFDALGKVELVKIYNYAATHGHEVTAKGWLKQFVGYNNSNKLEVGKNVDSISGATISVDAITEDIKEKTNLMTSYLSH